MPPLLTLNEDFVSYFCHPRITFQTTDFFPEPSLELIYGIVDDALDTWEENDVFSNAFTK